jgi:hypothetical protein
LIQQRKFAFDRLGIEYEPLDLIFPAGVLNLVTSIHNFFNRSFLTKRTVNLLPADIFVKSLLYFKEKIMFIFKMELDQKINYNQFSVVQRKLRRQNILQKLGLKSIETVPVNHVEGTYGIILEVNLDKNNHKSSILGVGI